MNATERELIRLLAAAILEATEGGVPNRLNDLEVPFDDGALIRLVELIEALVKSPSFANKDRFIVHFQASKNIYASRELKRLYLTYRRDLPRILSEERKEKEWIAFVNRFSHMPYSEFLTKERAILEAAGVDPRIIGLLLGFCVDVRPLLDDPENRPTVSPKRGLQRLAKLAKSRIGSLSGLSTIPINSPAAAIFIVADLSSFLVSAELDAASFLSGMAGATAQLADRR